jgi:hypothetical protein
MADRSRREKKDKLDKLAEYKRAREGGKRTWKVRDAIFVVDRLTRFSRRKQTLTYMTRLRRINIKLLFKVGSRKMIS